MDARSCGLLKMTLNLNSRNYTAYTHARVSGLCNPYTSLLTHGRTHTCVTYPCGPKFKFRELHISLHRLSHGRVTHTTYTQAHEAAHVPSITPFLTEKNTKKGIGFDTHLLPNIVEALNCNSKPEISFEHSLQHYIHKTHKH